jgi:hypothetical protein
MPFPSKKLRVFPNPYTYIDHLGRPAGRLPFDGFEHSPSPGSVGAAITDVIKIQSAMMMRVAGQDLEISPAQHDTRITYSKEAVEIPKTHYYVDAIKRLDLVAADSGTAQEAGVKFEDPAKVLAAYKAEAVARFNAETAEDAYARFGSVEPLYFQTAVQAPAKVESAKGDK